jgi:hypothetical protein
MSVTLEDAEMSKTALKVSPKEMRWGIDQEPEILIPNELPYVKGVFQDIVTYIEKEFPEINSQKVWRLAIDGIPRRFFYTPHNKRVCWRDKNCYDSLFIWEHYRREKAQQKPTFVSKIKKALGLD